MLINQGIAIKIMLMTVSLIILFHISILLKIIPYEFTWGGRLQNDTEMYVFEAISILINLLLVGVLLIKGAFIKRVISIKIVNSILWVFLVLFGLNTIGNIVAVTYFEKLFAIVTLAFSVLIWIILKGKDNLAKVQ